jgi:hypothetical protein
MQGRHIVTHTLSMLNSSRASVLGHRSRLTFSIAALSTVMPE